MELECNFKTFQVYSSSVIPIDDGTQISFQNFSSL